MTRTRHVGSTFSQGFGCNILETSITFDKLPEAVTYLTGLVNTLLGELRELRNTLSPPKDEASDFIDSKEACAILGECRNTLYNKARSGTIPAYKNPGGKGWRFKRGELLGYMASGKPKSHAQKYDEMVAEMNKGLRPGGRNKSPR